MNTPRKDDPGGQISELYDMAEVQDGGADSTDKSTGTAPHHAADDEADATDEVPDEEHRGE